MDRLPDFFMRASKMIHPHLTNCRQTVTSRMVHTAHSAGGRVAIFFMLLLCPFALTAQSSAAPDFLVLQTAKLPFTPKEFYVAEITDTRKDRKPVAYLLTPAQNPAAPDLTRPVDLQGGTLSAIRQFVGNSLPRNTRLRPVLIRLNECRITETPGTGSTINGEVALSMSFHHKRGSDTVHLVNYRGGIRYARSANQTVTVEQALRQSLVGSLQYLNNWMEREADTNEKLARGVKVTFTDYTINEQADTVFYSSDRPLTWADFRDRPRTSKYAAAVFPSFAQDGKREIRNGIIHVQLVMKVYVLKDASWVKEGARDEYALNHEQRHFDIVKLVAERFKRKVLADTFTVEDYDGQIGYLFLESYREMNRLQDQYDEETSHSLNRDAQEQWNRRIDSELRAFFAKEG
jgi:hypothetical protein